MIQSPLIMIIRHAEKPTSESDGVDTDGNKDSRSLAVRGWQRAGALVPFFDPSLGPVRRAGLATPAHLFASSTGTHHTQSHRERETLAPLAQKLGIEIDLTFDKGQEDEVAAAAMERSEAVLIAWEHKSIAKLARCISGEGGIPEEWPDDRFDLIYVFRKNDRKTRYFFAQMPQLLLAGDSPTLNPV